MSRLLLLPLVVCFLLSIAAIDSIPDPPATKQSTGISSSDTAAHPADIERDSHDTRAAADSPYPMFRWFGFVQSFENRRESPAIVRNAANSSPPIVRV
jgi:hypothetical protein